MVISKLLNGTRGKWSRKVLLIRRKPEKEPGLPDFTDFVNDENLIVTGPVLFKEAVEKYIYKKAISRKTAS